MKYEVQHYTFCDGWVNTWTETNEDGETQMVYFETPEQAFSALMDFIDQEKDQEYPYEISEFRISQINSNKSPI